MPTRRIALFLIFVEENSPDSHPGSSILPLISSMQRVLLGSADSVFRSEQYRIERFNFLDFNFLFDSNAFYAA